MIVKIIEAMGILIAFGGILLSALIVILETFSED